MSQLRIVWLSFGTIIRRGGLRRSYWHTKVIVLLWLLDCIEWTHAETSAIGRALANAGYAAKGKRASREEMAKVSRGDAGHKVEHPWKPDEKPVANEPVTVVWDDFERKAFDENDTFIADLQKSLGATVEGFTCAHGQMLRKEGTGKTGKPYMGYVCGAKSKSEQCPAKWGNWVNGTWVFEGKANV